MAKKRELIINLGSSHISVSIFFLEEKISLQEFFFQDIELENFSESEWLASVEQVLAELCKKNKLSGTARFILPGSLVLSKTIRIPKVEESKKRKIVEYELSQKLPFAIKDLSWDFSTIDDDGIEEEVLSFAIKPETAQKLCQIVYRCGFLPTQFIPAAILDHESVCSLPNTANQECLFLNVGAKSTNVIFKNPNGFLTRTLSLGGITLTELISEKLATSLIKSERLKLDNLGEGANINDANNEQIFSEVLQNFHNKFAQELTRSVVTYKRIKKGKTPQCIYVTGRGVKTKGLLNLLASSQRLPLHYFNPYELFSLDTESFDEETLVDLPYLISEPAGLAKQIKNSTSHESLINLLPKSKVREIEKKKKLPWLALTGLLTALLPVPWLFQINSEISFLNKHLSEKKSEIKKLESLAQKNKECSDELLSLQQLNKHSSGFVNILHENSEKTSCVQDFLNSLQGVVDNPDNKNTWIDTVSFYAAKQTPSNLNASLKSNKVIANISGRYLVALDPNIEIKDINQKHMALIDSNGHKQESLTNSLNGIKQVVSVVNKVFSTEGKGDLYNRQFTYFEFDLEIDFVK